MSKAKYRAPKGYSEPAAAAAVARAAERSAKKRAASMATPALASELVDRIHEGLAIKHDLLRPYLPEITRLSQQINGGEFLIITSTGDYKIVCDADTVGFYQDEIVVADDPSGARGPADGDVDFDPQAELRKAALDHKGRP